MKFWLRMKKGLGGCRPFFLLAIAEGIELLISPLEGIGAKIALAWTETCAFVVVRASDIARHGDFGAGPPRKVE
jgi:hypothetical protein